MNKKYLLGSSLLLIFLIIGGGIWQMTQHSPSKANIRPSESQRAPLPKEVTIVLDKNGFTPKEVTIKAGSAIRWKNESGTKQTVNSDNYPTNQLHKELNFGIFPNGSSVVYTFTKPGVYGYHNQFHPEQKGKITVVK
jgi:plastocyanin